MDDASPDITPWSPAGDPARGVFGISVAADMVGMDPQSLRLYEKRGLLEPMRTPGGTRLYSSNDLVALARVGQLLDDGLNLAGVSAVFDLEAANTALTAEVLRLKADNARLRSELRSRTGSTARRGAASRRQR